MKRATAVALLVPQHANDWNDAAREIAKQLGLSRSWVSRWPEGELPEHVTHHVVMQCVRMNTAHRIERGEDIDPLFLDAVFGRDMSLMTA